MKKIKVKYRKLGKQKVWGLADLGDYTIEVDSTLKNKKLLEIIIHESLHILHPELSEEEIVNNSVILTNTLWHEKYRKVEIGNSPPLQDGSK